MPIDATSTDTSTAIEISKLKEQSNQEVKKQHLRRLTQLLDVNGLVMTAVPSDEDCCFASTLHMVRSVNPLLTISSLQELVCDHILEYRSEFEPFTSSGKFMSDIGYLQKAGHWNYNLGNAVPLAIANLFQTKVTIISSLTSHGNCHNSAFSTG